MGYDKIATVVNQGVDIIGVSAGTLIGGYLANIEGATVGAIAGATVANAIKNVSSEILNRTMSKRQSVRLGAVINYAVEQINENIANAKPFASEIVDASCFHRNSSEEVLENVLISAKNTYEEKKIKHIGKLYGNLLFHDKTDLQQANFMIRLIDRLSYRQLCLIRVLQIIDELNFENTVHHKIDSKSTVYRSDLVCEFRDLMNNGLIKFPAVWSDIENSSSPLKIDSVTLTKLGQEFHELSNLDEIDKNDINSIKSKIFKA